MYITVIEFLSTSLIYVNKIHLRNFKRNRNQKAMICQVSMA